VQAVCWLWYLLWPERHLDHHGHLLREVQGHQLAAQQLQGLHQQKGAIVTTGQCKNTAINEEKVIPSFIGFLENRQFFP
jgi:hypothetical protein